MKISLLINMKMPTLVGIFIFISREIFMHSWVEHEKGFITSEPGPQLFVYDLSAYFIIALQLYLWNTLFQFMEHLVPKIWPYLCLTFTTLWANSANSKLMIFFLRFPRKQDLKFHANYLQSRQFDEISKPVLLGKIRKILQYVLCWKFYIEC